MTEQLPIAFPRDQYAHPGAASEWWWHIGTLKSGERTFGFEIALNGPAPAPGGAQAMFTQIMLTDVLSQRHYQQTSGLLYSADWASADPAGPFHAVINGPQSSGCMTAFATNPTEMFVQASFTDWDTSAQIVFQLRFAQDGPPLLIWGNGEQHGNFYYSFTDVRASGQISIDGEIFPVTGVTWMDHEWGVFPPGTAWVLQNMQLENGISLMNYASNVPVKLGVPVSTTATILEPDGRSVVEDGLATPLTPAWTDRKGNAYFTKWKVEIPARNATFEVTSLLPGQAFEQKVQVYEGVAEAVGTWQGKPVRGTAWIEQRPDSTSS
jgi:predicted secreted hydrolase